MKVRNLSRALLADDGICRARRSSITRTRICILVLFLSCLFSGCSQDLSEHDDENPAVPAVQTLDTTRSRAAGVDAADVSLPASESHHFDCGDAGKVEFRLIGPDTIEVIAGTNRYTMQHQRTASGARYESDGAVFWNKGDEALLTIRDQRFECKRTKAAG